MIHSSDAYNFNGMSLLITGGAGVLGKAMVKGLVAHGASVAILDYNLAAASDLAEAVEQDAGPGKVIALQGNVLQKESIAAAVEATIAAFRKIDALINAAGGNKAEATTSLEKTFFDLPADALRAVFELNLIGAILPSQIVGRHMAERSQGTILNISSMNSFRPLTRVPAYSAAKAGVSNFTQWLAVHMAQEYSPKIRVNALAPGFFLTQQNHYLLIDQETGGLTERGQKILDHTPMERFGDPDDLIGPMLWLLSPAAAFITGVVVPVDGGFSAYSGV